MLRSFAMFIRQIGKDSMLAAACAASLLTAVFIRFGVPAIESVLCDYLEKEALLTEYYLLT